MLNRTSKKFLLGFLGIVLVALLVWAWGAYLNPEVREKRALIKYFENLEAESQNNILDEATTTQEKVEILDYN
ncbi:MAG: hypothetical protein HYT93_05185 [Parcubacteria group bacterium]|nr:hypothetical protein [Parcubacteria group bacterium]